MDDSLSNHQKHFALEHFIHDILFCLTAFVLSLSGVLYSFDHFLSDRLYQVPTPVNHNVTILAIDEKTVAAYGDPSAWTREIPARLVETLTGENGAIPVSIVLDMLYIGKRRRNRTFDLRKPVKRPEM